MSEKPRCRERCCYCDDGPNVFCWTEDFNLSKEDVRKLHEEKEE